MEYIVNAHLKRFNLLTSEINAAYHDAALKMGLSDSAFHILYTLCWCDGECPLSDITTGVSKQTINSALRKLEAENIVRLETYQGRKKKVSLTDAGYSLAKEKVLPLIAIENEIFGSWSDEEKNLYIELTRQYLSVFTKKIKEL